MGGGPQEWEEGPHALLLHGMGKRSEWGEGGSEKERDWKTIRTSRR